MLTQSPEYTCKGKVREITENNSKTKILMFKGHNNWVLCIAWSPDSSKLASACKNGKLIIWDPENGQQIGKTMSGHSQWITSLSWEPYHQ